jgi:periplasmic divalent cation tolerance protein
VRGRLVALSTTASAADAERIARALVERRLAACVNLVPGVVSIYRWKRRVARDAEHLLVIKTRAERLSALRTALVSLHSYDVPELVALPVVGGHAPYLEWLDGSVRGKGRPTGGRSAAGPRRPRARRAPGADRPRGPRRPRTRR